MSQCFQMKNVGIGQYKQFGLFESMLLDNLSNTYKKQLVDN